MTRKNIVISFNSSRYGKFYTSRKNNQIRINKLLSQLKKGYLVLDLGCGDGHIMEKIKKAGGEVVGIDISNESIELAKNKGFEVYKFNLEEDWSIFFKNKFDLVVAGEIIEHVYDTDNFLRCIYKVLKVNGKLSISTPNVASIGRRIMLFLGINPFLETTLRKKDAGHIRYFTFHDLRHLLKEHSFDIIKEESSEVVLSKHGMLSSPILADMFPTLGTTIIIHSKKH